ncbi:MAG: translocation/assembly module TamB domain-containing protein [Pseudorhodobacter sp.]|nr:translocation/assembly module TamB domain-containing protein [Pseudorhodobacter sp.]
MLTFLLWLLLPCAALAQSDDRSYLTAFLEDNLSDIGRTVTITGFAGALSSRATMTEMTIADSEGVWITLKDVALQWNRSALLSGRISVNTLTAAEIIVARPPIREASGAVLPEAKGFALPELPVSVEIGQIAAAKISLGAPVLGSALEGRLEASLALIGGEGAVDLLLERTDDGPAGRLALVASYANGSGQLAIDLDAREAAGGVAATLLGLPGVPAVVLTIKGAGPITEYSADLRLASDGVDRLTGRVSLQARSENGQRFSANLSGDLAPLFLPAYAEFFGPVVQLQLTGIREGDGRLDLNQLSLRTKALTMDGGLVLAADGLPEKFDLTGRLGQEDGLPVLLPLSPDQPTSVTSADLALAFDATKGDGWQGSASLIGLARADFRAQALRLVGSGQIKRGGASAGNAVLRFEAQGLAVSDPGLAQVLGDRLNGNATLNWQQGSGAVTLSRLTLDGSGYGLVAEGRIEGLASGFAVTGTASARFDDLARLSTLAGRPLAGRGAAQVAGSGSLLGGSFDLEGSIFGTDLHLGQRELDNLLRGTARIGLSLRRDQTGTLIRRLEIAARTLTAAVTGRVATAGSDLAADLAFSDLAVLGGGYRGALTGTGHFVGTPKTGTLTLEALADGLAVGQGDADRVLAGQTQVALALAVRDGQISLNRAELTNPQLAASATGTAGQRGLDLTARLTDLALLLPDFPGAVTLSGSAVEGGQGAQVDLRLLGPGRIDAGVSGTVAPGYGQADLAIVGTGQAGLANGLIAPRTASGPLRFDLRLNGPFALASLVGRVALAGGRITDPDHAIAATDITATADLAGGQAQITASAGASTGGQLRASGAVGLSAPYKGDLTIDLQSVGINDPQLYRTTASGQVTVSGPVGGGALIAGRLVLGTTELRLPSTGLGGAGALPDLRHVNEPADVRATRARAGLVDAGRAGRSGPPFRLDLTIEAPSRVFIRGRGLDAELGGVLTLGGTTAAVVPNGAFNLIRGRLDILGKRLVLSEARLQLEGKFLPFVRILASNESDGITTSVLIEGPADAPSVRFVSTPELPEEEVLSRLLFGRDFTSLSVFQAAQLAGAVAILAGRGGEGIISKLRKGFGLDDLDLTTDATGGASIKAGKYLSKNLHTEIIVDQQGQSQINLDLDLSPSITLRGSTSSDSTGIGIFLEKDY